MAVDGQSPIAGEGEAPAMPEKSDLDATEDEDDDLDTTPPPPPSRLGKIGGGAKGKVLESGSISKEQNAGPTSPPPRRELPFAAKKGGKLEAKPEGGTNAAQIPTGDDVPEAEEEDEDSDDEL